MAQSCLKVPRAADGFHRHSETGAGVLADRPIGHKAATMAYEAHADRLYAISTCWKLRFEVPEQMAYATQAEREYIAIMLAKSVGFKPPVVLRMLPHATLST